MISPEVLRRYPFFATANDETLKLLAMSGETRTYEAGQVLFQDGDAADHLLVLTEGEVDIQYVLQDGEHRTVDTRVAGDIVLWSALVVPFKTTANGVARRRTRVVALDALKLRELCETDHELGYHLMREIAQVMSHRLQGARVQLATVG
jgi:CRP-like cAMP-binding protein